MPGYTWWIGLSIILLLICLKPAIRRTSHHLALQRFRFDGATMTSSWMRFAGLRIVRPAWTAEVEFKPAFEKGGHLHFRADLGRSTPDVIFEPEAGGARAMVPSGDEAFAEKLLTPALRDRLLRLGALGGRLWYVRGGKLEIVGPLVSEEEQLRPLLELCAEVADLAAAATAEGR